MKHKYTRRRFLAQAGVVATGTVLPPSSLIASVLAKGGRTNVHEIAEHHKRKKVIVLGIDGLDPRLCERMIGEGQLPALARMRKVGGYRRLGTSIPPQSPVAWANFITGADPGVHGIFDFIHRDPAKQYYPYYAAAETVTSMEGWDVGEYRIPLTFWPFEHTPT